MSVTSGRVEAMGHTGANEAADAAEADAQALLDAAERLADQVSRRIVGQKEAFDIGRYESQPDQPSRSCCSAS